MKIQKISSDASVRYQFVGAVVMMIVSFSLTNSSGNPLPGVAIIAGGV
jgi:hypothetical protein